MKTFEVTIMRTAYASYTVEAESEDEAQELVWDQYDPSDADDCAGNDIYSVEELTDENE